MEYLDGIELQVETLPRMVPVIKDSFLDIEIDPIAFPSVVDPMDYRKPYRGKGKVTTHETGASSSKAKDIDDKTYEEPTLFIDVPHDSQDPNEEIEDWKYYLNYVDSDDSDMESAPYDGWNDPSDHSPKGTW